MNYYEPIVYTVTEEEEGWRLSSVMRTRMTLSRKLISRLKMTECGILVNDTRQYTSYKVRAGDVIKVRMKEEESEDIAPEPIPIDVLYEDAHLLIVNKPAGMIVHPTHGHYTHTLANGVVHYWQQRGERYRFRPIHRLDQDTSGVLAIAKNPFIHQQLSEQLQRHEVDKQYIALVHGRVELDKGTVDAPIDRNPLSLHLRIVIPTGYPSITHYEVIERFKGATLLSMRLETGRTHQIRVHMKHLGHSLIGDPLYGDERADNVLLPEPALRQALHAVKLGFLHPMIQKYVSYEAPLPEDMQTWIDYLRKEIG